MNVEERDPQEHETEGLAMGCEVRCDGVRQILQILSLQEQLPLLPTAVALLQT
jgi:hypothetical protein